MPGVRFCKTAAQICSSYPTREEIPKRHGLVVEPQTPEKEVGVRYSIPYSTVLGTLLPEKYWLPRKRSLRPDMTEQLFNGTFKP